MPALAPNAFTPSQIAEWAANLETLLQETGTFINRFQWQPATNSQAEIELGSFPDPEKVVTAFGQGAILQEVAADQLMTFLRSIVEPVQTFAPWTCVRAVLENSAMAAWLFDPTISVTTRVERSLTFRLEGLDQQGKWLRAAGQEAALHALVQRIAMIEQEAISLGSALVQDRQGRRIGVGQRMPSATEVITAMLDEGNRYRLFSAVTHGHLWALQQLGMRPAVQLAASSIASVQTTTMEKHLDTNSIVFLIATAVPAFTKPFWFMCQLFGWDNQEAMSLLERNYDALKMQAVLRFWRPKT